jgi:hypothetical protein
MLTVGEIGVVFIKIIAQDTFPVKTIKKNRLLFKE